jgi:hypothetical protein
MPMFPETRDAITGTPAAAASQMTLAPPSIRELSTSAWLRESQRSAAQCGTFPNHR